MKNRKNTIPDDVYVEFVRSLFGRVNTVLAGAVIHWLAAFLAYLDSGKPSYLVLSFLLLAAGIWRWAGMRRVMLHETITTRAQAEHWERYYILWGTLQILVLGTFCFVGIYFDSGYFAAVAALSVTVGSMPTVVGRNYGSARMVQIFSAASVLPIGAGFVMHGHLSYVILGLLIIPFYLILTGTAQHVRQVLFSAVVGHKEARKLAQRFDRALNTMPHGLVMLNPDGRVIVANREAAHALKVNEPSRLLGRSLNALLMRGVAGGLLMPKDCRYIETQLTRALLDGRDRRLQIRAADGRHFELSARAGDDELGVITFEEITARVEAEERIRHMAAMPAKATKLFYWMQNEVKKAGGVNVFQPAPIGGALSKQVYLPAVFEFAEGEALILETDLPEVRPYWNFQLNDPYFNAVEYVYRLSSTNGHFARLSSDGKFRAVISLEDPGVPNWLDPAGYREGTIYGRWYDCDSCPTPTLKRVPFAELRDHLPADTPTVTPAERAEELRARVRACQRRRRW